MPIRHKIPPDPQRILGRLTEEGFESYIVGGAVRDLLLDRDPKDYDFATSAPPRQIVKTFGRKRARIIGRRFKLVHLRLGGKCYEISTFRRKPTQKERKGRVDDDGVMIWRDNKYGSLEQDASRRDFTVNALYFNPLNGGGLVDLVGGGEDLKGGVVRAIGEPEVRLAEDPVRILRALKLAGQYGFRLEDELANAVSAAGQSIQQVSKARLFDELLKILDSASSLKIFDACLEADFLRYFWPKLHKELSSLPGNSEIRKVLEARNRHLAAGGYSTSKALAIATVSIGSATRRLDEGDGELSTLWTHRGGLERPCRQAIRSFFEPFPVSRYLSARARDIILLQPRLKKQERKKPTLKHPEYRYARELLKVLTEALGWSPELTEFWPHRPSRRRKRRSRSRRRRKRHSRKRRKR